MSIQSDDEHWRFMRPKCQQKMCSNTALDGRMGSKWFKKSGFCGIPPQANSCKKNTLKTREKGLNSGSVKWIDMDWSEIWKCKPTVLGHVRSKIRCKIRINNLLPTEINENHHYMRWKACQSSLLAVSRKDVFSCKPEGLWILSVPAGIGFA